MRRCDAAPGEPNVRAITGGAELVFAGRLTEADQARRARALAQDCPVARHFPAIRRTVKAYRETVTEEKKARKEHSLRESVDHGRSCLAAGVPHPERRVIAREGASQGAGGRFAEDTAVAGSEAPKLGEPEVIGELGDCRFPRGACEQGSAQGMEAQMPDEDPRGDTQILAKGVLQGGPGEVLVLGNTRQPGFAEVLRGLAGLPYVARIQPAWFE